MNTRDPKLIALFFNECINTQDIDGLVSLMTNDHSLICFDHVDTIDKESSRMALGSDHGNLLVIQQKAFMQIHL